MVKVPPNISLIVIFPSLAFIAMLARMRPPEFPAALGIIRAVSRQTFDEGLLNQLEHEKENAKFKTVDELLKSGETWEVTS